MRKRRWAGLSQLDCVNHGRLDELVNYAPQLQEAARNLFDRLVRACPVESAVFDLAVLNDGLSWRAVLVEVNPWGPLTDAALFSWAHGGDFDGGFRYLT